jgi:hypothetical protein
VLDLVFVAVVLACFAVAGLVVQACELVVGRRTALEEDRER